MFAWDTSNNAPDESEDDGRSYISAVSEIITNSNEACYGRAKKEMGEARMDIEDSEMAYLGFHDGESYGLTWKVRVDVSGAGQRVDLLTMSELFVFPHGLSCQVLGERPVCALATQKNYLDRYSCPH